MSAKELVNQIERRIASRIVDVALGRGWSISVNDGEVWTLKRSTDKDAILNAMATTEMDTLSFRDAQGNKLGVVVLIYGNEDDLISDASDNAAMDEFCCAIARPV